MRLIIFDIDGTLLDSQDHIVAAQIRALAAHGYPAPTREAALAVVGLSLREAFAALVGPDGPLDSLSDSYKQAWTALRMAPGFEERLYPGAAALIAEMAGRPDIRLGIATGKSRAGVARVIAAQGWDGAFATIQTADTHPSKPDPSMIATALTETDVPAADTVMIGDTTFDMAMAVAAGVHPIGVAWGYHPRAELLASGAAAVADDMPALRRLLQTPTSEAA